MAIIFLVVILDVLYLALSVKQMIKVYNYGAVWKKLSGEETFLDIMHKKISARNQKKLWDKKFCKYCCILEAISIGFFVVIETKFMLYIYAKDSIVEFMFLGITLLLSYNIKKFFYRGTISEINEVGIFELAQNETVFSVIFVILSSHIILLF